MTKKLDKEHLDEIQSIRELFANNANNLAAVKTNCRFFPVFTPWLLIIVNTTILKMAKSCWYWILYAPNSNTFSSTGYLRVTWTLCIHAVYIVKQHK